MNQAVIKKPEIIVCTKQAKVSYVDQMICKGCYQTTLIKPQGLWVVRCTQCNRITNFYQPLPFQQLIINDPATIIIMMTAYGFGKTTLSAYYWSIHLRKFKKSLVLACAQTKDQLSKLIKPELQNHFLEDEFVIKNENEWVLDNGSKIVFVADKNDEAIRSANASGVWIVEASGVNEKYFYEGLARIRNSTVNEYQKDEHGNLVYYVDDAGNKKPKILKSHTKVIVETNPSFGWVKNLMLKSKRFLVTEKVANKDLLLESCSPGEMDIVSCMATVEDNPYLTVKFIEQLKASRSLSEQALFLYCDLTQANSLIFQDVANNKSKYFVRIPNELQSQDYFIESLDPGGALVVNDATAYILAKYNRTTKQVVILSAWKNKGSLLSDDCARIQATREAYQFNPDRSYFFTADTAINKASKEDGKKLADSYALRLQTRIDTQGVKVGGIKSGLELIKAYLLKNKIVINQTYTQDLWDEFKQYRYEIKSKFNKVTKELEEEMIIAGEDHLMDALRYLIVKLDSFEPLDQNLINQTIINNELIQEKNQRTSLLDLIKQQQEEAEWQELEKEPTADLFKLPS